MGGRAKREGGREEECEEWKPIMGVFVGKMSLTGALNL